MNTKVLFALVMLVGLLYYASLQFPTVRAASSNPPPDSIENADPVTLPQEFVRRGNQWVDVQVPLNPDGLANGYRTDDAGLVSYAWALPLTETHGAPDWNREVRFHFAVEVPLEALQPGDALTNWRTGDYGHTLLFEKWLDPDQAFTDGAKFIAQEMQKTWHRALKNVYTLQFKNGATTIKELEAVAPGPYYAVRNNQVPGYVTVKGDLHLSMNAPTVGKDVAVEFSILNPGGKPVAVHGLQAAVRGPNATAEGWNAASADFDPAADLVLQPGETYTYKATRTFETPGSYFVEPAYDQSGVQSIPPSPREWLTVSPQ